MSSSDMHCIAAHAKTIMDIAQRIMVDIDSVGTQTALYRIIDIADDIQFLAGRP